MAPSSTRSDQPQPRDIAYWAQIATTLTVYEVPSGVINLNVEGRRMAGPLQGFGPLWQKTYRVRLSGATATPSEVIEAWKERFPQLQPPQARYFPAVAGVRPGEIVLLNASMAGIPVDAGVVVVYADAESFTLMTPEGLPEAGWITCSATVESECTVAQIQTIGRANDPIYEIGFRLAGAAEQEKIWAHVLAALAEHFGVNGQVQTQKTCVDPRIQWSRAGNVWHNAALRSMLYLATHPAQLLHRLERR